MEIPKYRVKTFYRGNIPEKIVTAQAKVFGHLGIPLEQMRNEDLTHSQWLDQVFTTHDELIIVCDIDAFPLSRGAFDNMVARALNGSVVGLEQVANHLAAGTSYAGPMFLAVRRDTFERTGRPSLKNTGEYDVAQVLTVQAGDYGIPVEMIPPRFAMVPKWALGERGIFGIGTFYGEMDFFHLFESRSSKSAELFEEVARGVISGHHDFGRYLQVVQAPKTDERRSLLRSLWRKWA